MDTKKIKSHDFGKDVIPYMVSTGRKVIAYNSRMRIRK